ncbi:MAG TPA: glucose-1-phosphate adenylyltransferase [Vicinamibacterales bacterium]|jgi:glucose-1-phosphate adenylyltransferase|nr:glucose-1-phosphate adenylyltransferase [Vicinamibacterales bacterium]
MAVDNEVLALVLGGGQGTRLFPLTQHRSKPAVPIGGKYRLIDIPVSNCLHADIRRIFVLTQFNSASLNRHVSQTYRMDLFSHGFVEILAAEQTPDNPNWYQGTADAVRQAARHYIRYDADYYLILAGDHLYRMDYNELVDAHIDRRADITIAAQPMTAAEASGMGIFRFDRSGQIVAFEEKPSRDRLEEIGQSIPANSTFAGHSREKPFVASMGIYVFSRDVLLDVLQRGKATDFGREVIPAALDSYRVHAYLFRGYWVDVGTVASFYDANIMLTESGARFGFYDPRRPIYTHPRFLPGARFSNCTVRDAIIAEGCFLDGATVDRSIVGIRTNIQTGTTITRSVLLGADFYEADDDAPAMGTGPRMGIGRDVTLDRVIVDKNARIGDGVTLVNHAQVDHADGPGYYIRNGVIIVPKDGVVKPGTIA